MSRKDRVASATKRRKLSHNSEEDFTDGRFDGVSKESSDTGITAIALSEDGSPEPQTMTTIRAAPRRTSMNTVADAPAGGNGVTSVLAVQVKELLKETTPKYDRHSAKIERVADEITKLIRHLTARGPFTAAEAEKYARENGNIGIPFPSPRPNKESNIKYEYQVPSSITIRGPSANRLGVKGPEDVVIAVQMPSSLLQEKDYLNLRAFHKRAFYLARIAAGVKDAISSEFVVQYDLQDAVDLLPVVALTPAGNSEKVSSQVIRYLICIDFPANAFELGKTLPSKNCVRWTQQKPESSPAPTPFYNSCLRIVASQDKLDELVAAAVQRCDFFSDACRLGQLWLVQRDFGTSLAAGGFGWWEWAVMCALLLQTGGPRGQALFSDRYSSLQLFKAMLRVLATRDLTQPWILRSDDVEIGPSEVPVLYDGKTGVNLLFKIQGASYQSLRQYAQLSLAAVNSKKDDSFDSTFIYRAAEPSLQFDEIYAFNMDFDSKSFEQGGVIGKLFRILKQGLADRVALLDIKASEPLPWKLSLPNAKVKSTTVQVRLIVDPDNVSRLVDHGPPAEEPEAATEFQRFWGSKSELRRFKDGSITESLVWNSTEPVTLQIVQHLLQRHFSLEPKTVRTEQSRIDEIALPAASVTAKDAFTLVYQKFQSLTSTLHSLTDLPLPIRSVAPASESLRSTMLTPPLIPSAASPISLLVQFDSSSRWPDSLPAIQHTKIAFLLKLGDALSAQDTSLTTRVGLENTSSSTQGHLNTAYLDIIYPSPAPTLAPLIFRLRIHHDRELHLLQTALADKSLHGATRDTIASALATHKREFIASPAHTTALRTLMTRFPALSSTIRLLKKWASSHMLSQHIPNEALELIAAHVFVHPAPWTTPGSPTTAFLRCLCFLAKWDWAMTPLIVDLSLGQEMAVEQRAELKTRFEAWRKLDPNMNQVSWFIGSNVDESGVAWTGSGRVEKVVAGRVTALAAACMDVVRGAGGGLGEDIARGLFVSGVEEYDFLISLDRSVVKTSSSKAKQKGKERYRNLEVAAETDVDAVGFEPVQDFLDDLRTTFGGTALFFYGASGDGGKVIAGLWRPGVKSRREWKVRLGWSSVPLREKGGEDEGGGGKEMAEVNKRGILKEIEIMGEGLVKEVKLQN